MKGEFINGFRMRKGLQGNAVRYACYLLSENPDMPVSRFVEAVATFADISPGNSGWLTKESSESKFPTGKLWTRRREGIRGYVTLMPEAMPLVGTHVTADEFKEQERKQALESRGLEVGSLVSWNISSYPGGWGRDPVYTERTGIVVSLSTRGRKTVEVMHNGRVERMAINSLSNVNIKE